MTGRESFRLEAQSNVNLMTLLRVIASTPGEWPIWNALDTAGKVWTAEFQVASGSDRRRKTSAH
jgi:hypothetical protein